MLFARRRIESSTGFEERSIRVFCGKGWKCSVPRQRAPNYCGMQRSNIERPPTRQTVTFPIRASTSRFLTRCSNTSRERCCAVFFWRRTGCWPPAELLCITLTLPIIFRITIDPFCRSIFSDTPMPNGFDLPEISLPINRLRASEFADLYSECGHELLFWKPHVDEDSRRALGNGFPLHSRFRSYTPD